MHKTVHELSLLWPVAQKNALKSAPCVDPTSKGFQTLLSQRNSVSKGQGLIKIIFFCHLLSRSKVFVPESVNDSHQGETGGNDDEALLKREKKKLKGRSDTGSKYVQYVLICD